jgi:hypothetical protein
MTPAQRELLFRLIQDACTNAQLRSLLRLKKQDDKAIRISGSTAELTSHLRTAFEAGSLALDDLTRLLASGEENGRQHIFFYYPRAQVASRYADPNAVWGRLLKATGTSSTMFPRFVLEPTQRHLSDIRLQSLRNEQSNVLIKWYSSRRVERIVNEREETRHGDTIIVRELKVDQVRLVSMIRYHPRGLLEVRIPTGERESRRTCAGELQDIWDQVSGVFVPDHFEPLSLLPAMSWLVRNADKRGATHRVSVVRAKDGSASAEFNPAAEGQDLFKAHRHRAALKKYDEFAALDVFWKPPLNQGGEDEEIRCQFAPYDVHGVRLGAKRTQAEVDFVVNRIWEHCRPTK